MATLPESYQKRQGLVQYEKLSRVPVACVAGVGERGTEERGKGRAPVIKTPFCSFRRTLELQNSDWAVNKVNSRVKSAQCKSAH